MQFFKGQRLILDNAAHAYSCAGVTDPDHIVPAYSYEVTVLSVRKTKRGPKLMVTTGEMRFGLLPDEFPSWRTVREA